MSDTLDANAEAANAEAVVLLALLREPKAEKARASYLKLFNLPDFDDQAFYDAIEEKVFDAILRQDPVVEMRREQAHAMLLVLKAGIRRSRGGQRKTRHEELSKRVFVNLARRRKQELLEKHKKKEGHEGGMTATEAHLRAAEETAEEGHKWGFNFTAGYLAREMDNPNTDDE